LKKESDDLVQEKKILGSYGAKTIAKKGPTSRAKARWRDHYTNKDGRLEKEPTKSGNLVQSNLRRGARTTILSGGSFEKDQGGAVMEGN